MTGKTLNDLALARALTVREIQARYKGSLLGMSWSVIYPVLMLIVYTFVFSVVFKARWLGGSESKTEFALILFAGLIVFNLFAECVNRAPGLVLGNVSYVKKVVFPLYILPIVSVWAALFNALVSILVWMFFYVFVYGLPSPTIIMLPVIFLHFSIMILGISYLLCAVGVYLRDIGQLIGVVTSMLMFLSPIFYPLSALPKEYHELFLINPMTSVIEQVRNVIFFGKWLPLLDLLKSYTSAIVILAFGFFVFARLKKGFSDVV